MDIETTAMKNRIDEAFGKTERNLLNVYFTAGYPDLDDTIRIARDLELAGVDIIELGMPYSDPLADGPTIQASSMKSLANGMTINYLFQQLKELRKEVSVPVILMGYLNPVIQYGIKDFSKKCSEVGIDGLIIPDLPMDDYINEYKRYFKEAGIYNIFLISPQTSEARIRFIDQNTDGFIYMVSSYSITGGKSGITDDQIQYFQRIEEMGLGSRTMIGFGISDYETYKTACEYSDGAIVGSAFIRRLEKDASSDSIHTFIRNIKTGLS